MSNSSGAGNLFDGDLSTFYGPDGNPQTFIPDTAIKVNRKLEIYYKSGSASRNASVNNGSILQLEYNQTESGLIYNSQECSEKSLLPMVGM